MGLSHDLRIVRQHTFLWHHSHSAELARNTLSDAEEIPHRTVHAETSVHHDGDIHNNICHSYRHHTQHGEPEFHHHGEQPAR